MQYKAEVKLVRPFINATGTPVNLQVLKIDSTIKYPNYNKKLFLMHGADLHRQMQNNSIRFTKQAKLCQDWRTSNRYSAEVRERLETLRRMEVNWKDQPHSDESYVDGTKTQPLDSYQQKVPRMSSRNDIFTTDSINELTPSTHLCSSSDSSEVISASLLLFSKQQGIDLVEENISAYLLDHSHSNCKLL